jgi:hypothetical protein
MSARRAAAAECGDSVIEPHPVAYSVSSARLSRPATDSRNRSRPWSFPPPGSGNVTSTTPRRQPGIGEDAEHGGVLDKSGGSEGVQPAEPAHRYQELQQQRGDAAAVHVIGHRERDLGRASGPGGLVARHSDQPAIQPGQQRHVIGAGRTAYAPGLLAGRAAAEAEEPQVQVLS